MFAFVALSGSSFHVVPTPEGPWRGVLDPPGPLRVGIALALALAAALLERVRPRLFGPLVCLGLAAAPLLPVATGRALPLLLFQGAALTLVLVSAGVVALADVLPRPQEPWPAALPLLAALAFLGALATRLPGPAGAQGDEPHYLTMAESLRSDLDLDLRDEFRQRAYRSFYPGDLEAHTSPASPRRRLYAVHTPGLPALVLPAYAAGGASAVRALLVLLTAGCAMLVFTLVRGVIRDEGAARLALAAFAGLAPIAFHADQIYPEVPAALLTAVFLHTARRRADPLGLLAAGAAAGALVWLHPKFLPLAVVGLVLTLLRRGRGVPWRVASILLFAAGLLSLLSWMNAVYGQPSLTAAYGPGATADVRWANLPRGLLGLLGDREFGLLWHAPLWGLVVSGLPALWRDRAGDAIRAALLAAPTVLVAGAYSMWWGGASLPGRFLVPAMPALALLVAPAIVRRPRLAAALLGFGLGVVLVAAEAPRALHNRADGRSALLRVLAPSLRLDRALPSFVGPDVAWDPLAASQLDPAGAALSALQGWDGTNVRSAAGRLAPELLEIPLLDGGPWALAAQETRVTPRIALPPGRYEIRVRGRLDPGLEGRLVRLVVTLDERDGARAFLGSDEPEPTLAIDLPSGERRFEVWATGVRRGATIDAITLRPVRVAPRGAR
ncbi:MAG TPA: hypothetical protein VFM88_00240 [Vicinamibacteria bacterium]|nr:hypothetical protein [Vicinamibacteria bacterium]